MHSWNNGSHINKSFSLEGIDLHAEYPEAVSEWLSNVYLMNEVPLHYMIPEKTMLPPESIRFFAMDQTWLKALTDGALSIGRDTSYDAFVDNAALSGIQTDAYHRTPMPRQRLMHRNHQRNSAKKQLTPEDKLSGFIMNSEIVKHFTGLEVKGSKNDQELQILRLDVLSEQIILCIFDGIVTSVTFQEPSEALSFGTKDRRREVPVRMITGDDVGKPCGGNITLKTNACGRVDIKAMADDLTAALKPQKNPITSKELALHLTCTANKCEIKGKCV